jgi:hypothetical protein
MLLGDVDELEEQREGAQDGGLALEADPLHGGTERRSRPAGAGVARERAESFLVVEEILSLLFDEHAPEQVAEETDVGP